MNIAYSILVLLLLLPLPSSALHTCQNEKGEEVIFDIPCERLGYRYVEKKEELETSSPDVPVSTTPDNSVSATVEEAIDGETIKVDVYGIGETVRLIGVETPGKSETKKPREDPGVAAARYADRALRGKMVILEFDTANSYVSHRDRYGQLLAYVYMGGVLFNAQIIREGYASVLTERPFSKMSDFHALEVEARERGVGLWSTGR